MENDKTADETLNKHMFDIITSSSKGISLLLSFIPRQSKNKTAICYLRNKGKKFKEISEELNMNRETVRKQYYKYCECD